MEGIASAEKKGTYNINMFCSHRTITFSANKAVRQVVIRKVCWQVCLCAAGLAGFWEGGKLDRVKWTANGAFRYTSSSGVLKFHSKINSINQKDFIIKGEWCNKTPFSGLFCSRPKSTYWNLVSEAEHKYCFFLGMCKDISVLIYSLETIRSDTPCTKRYILLREWRTRKSQDS